MIKLVTVFAVLLFLSCAPAGYMHNRPAYYPGQNALFNSENEVSDSMSDPDQIESNMGPYLKGYNDGMMTAKNVPLGGCMVGGCFIGAAGIVAGILALNFIDSENYFLPMLIFTGSISGTVGAVYLANRIAKVDVPDPMVNDTLYRRGFMEGYCVSFKSRRLNESLKGTAIGMGTTCAGYLVVGLLALFLFIHIIFMD